MKTRKDERKQGWPQGLMLRGASFRYSRMVLPGFPCDFLHRIA